ncbi:transposase [Mycobacterium parascrofulaceum ATCC BAA-614]|uniref:Transposase n=1 Tax=Mycobacterium parascrofulaceum ATCC BAA-614 TaxID=525368 RepID=D5P696_9MYCO|nr:IS110 family transposase [Mycobacterium parascrofulaceum]EFG78398.1 transposase [Mycobacterium parascrofulaceum ATCC BAA-614]
MVVIGVDAHKATHTMVAVDVGGCKLAEVTVRATTDGHLKALGWARREFGGDLIWGVEDCRNLSQRLERDLLNAGQRVVRVPPQLMARTRASARTRGKSDTIDALSVARAVLREPDLPVASHDPVSREFKLLMDRHDDLVSRRTALMNRLLWRVHELDPTHAVPSRSLAHRRHQQALRSWLETQDGLVAEFARDELAEIITITEVIGRLDQRITARAQAAAPSLLTLYGCGALTAAKLVGETAEVTRFRSEAAYARHAGLAPVPHSSGSKTVRIKPWRSGNRKINAALYWIALCQIKHGAPGEAYYRARRDSGDSHSQAIRRVERRIVRRVYRHMKNDHALTEGATQTAPAQHGGLVPAHSV